MFMKREYLRPAVRLVECHPAKFLAAGSGPTKSTMGVGENNEENIDDTSEPNPGARETGGIRWWDDQE